MFIADEIPESKIVNPFPPLTPDEHFARASGEARLALIWERLGKIQKTLEMAGLHIAMEVINEAQK